MEYSSDCAQLVKRFEDEAGYRQGQCTMLHSYLCPAGIWTAGWGHTRGVSSTTVISSTQADLWLLQDLRDVGIHLVIMLPPSVVLAQNQFDALCSLCYNLAGGPFTLPRKAPHLWGDILKGNSLDAAHEFLDMDHALVRGVPTELPGLKLRREAESALFLGEPDWRRYLEPTIHT